MMQDPHSVDIDMKYKENKYLHEAINERLLRQIRTFQNETSSKQRFWIGIQIIVKVIFQTRESLPQQISTQEKGTSLETSVKQL